MRMRTKSNRSLNRACLCEQLESRKLMSATVWQSSGASDENYAPIWPPERSEVRDLIVNLPDSTTLTDSMLSLGLANGDGSGANDGSANTDISSTVLGTPVLQSGYKWRVPITASTTYSDATGSLKNGLYHLTVTDGSDVTGAGFWRLQGDLNGDGVVNSSDTTIFSADVSSYSASADFNLDGAVNALDNLQYTHHDLGTSWSFPTVSTAATTSSLTETTVTLSMAGAVGAGYSSSQLTYQWELVSGPSGAPAPTFSANNSNAASTTVATVYQAGTYRFCGVIWDPALLDLPTPPVTSTVAPDPEWVQFVMSLHLTPGSTTLGAGAIVTLVPTAADQFNDMMVPGGGIVFIIDADAPYSSEKGTVAPSGGHWEFTSPTSVNVLGDEVNTVTFNDGLGDGIASNTIDITIEPIHFTAAAAGSVSDPTIGSTPTVNLTLMATSLDNSGLAIEYNWTISSGSYSNTGLLSSSVLLGGSIGDFNDHLNGGQFAYDETANMNTCGTFVFTCTATDGFGNSVSSSTTINVPQKFTTLWIPTSNIISDGTTGAMYIGPSGAGYATCKDQFGTPMAVAPSLYWMIPVGTGSINTSTGVYTAPSSGSGTDQIEVAGTSDYGTALSSLEYMYWH